MSYTLISDVTYSGSLKLDVYKPQRKLGPILIVIHGGGWVNGTKGLRPQTDVCMLYANCGYLCVDIDYSLVGDPGYGPQVPIDNTLACIQWARSNAATYNGDRDRVAVFGLSAGAHLGLMAAIQGTPGDSRPDAVVAWSPATDLENIPPPDDTQTSNYMGVPFIGNESAWRAKSPKWAVTSNSCPVRVVGSTNERIILSQFDTYHTAALAAGVASTKRLFNGTQHADFRGEMDTDSRPSTPSCDAEDAKLWLETVFRTKPSRRQAVRVRQLAA